MGAVASGQRVEIRRGVYARRDGVCGPRRGLHVMANAKGQTLWCREGVSVGHVAGCRLGPAGAGRQVV